MMQLLAKRRLISSVCSQIFRSMSSKKGHLDITAGKFRHQIVTPAVVAEKKLISPTVYSLIMKVEDPNFGFYAGQWVDFAIPGTDLVGGYSMCSGPNELRATGTLELAVKRSTWPPAVWVHQQCHVGSRVTLKAGGDFFFDPSPHESPRPLLLVAGGVGINPLVSILRHCRHLRAERCRTIAGYSPAQIVLLYSAKSRQELIFRDCISTMEKEGLVTAHLFVTSEGEAVQDDAFHYRRLTDADLQSALSSLGGDPLCYLCGPSRMVSDVELWLRQMGVAPSSVLYERWW